MLKPALARGELQCVGASTLNEYRKYIEKDGALERRFQTVIVEPPTVDETIEILKGLRQEVRGPSPDQHPGCHPHSRGGAVGALHHRPVPARQGHRRHRRGRRSRPPRLTGPPGRGGRAQVGAGEGQPPEGRRGPRSELRARGFAARSGARPPEPDPAQAGRVGEGPANPSSGHRRRGHRLHRLALDRHPGHPAPGGGDRAAAAHGRRDPRVGGRPGRGDHGGVPRHPPLACRAQGPQPSHRLVHLLRPHRRRQDRAGPRPGQVPLRRRAGADPGGHVGVHGEVLRVAPDRRASRATSATRTAAR